MTFYRLDVPVAYAMIALVDHTTQVRIEPFQRLMCYWAAFNNIYTKLATLDGKVPSLSRDKQGNVKMDSRAGMQIPKVRVVEEYVQINVAFSKFSDDLKHRLATHSSMEFFVYRTPRWHDQGIELDARGQRLNGVLNVGRTTSTDYPVWSPIDAQAYERYQNSPNNYTDRDQLAKQILDLIYTVRNNTFHGGKRVDDANDREVVEKAFPLLKEIVDSFLQDPG